jgi:hypothetical protein
LSWYLDASGSFLILTEEQVLFPTTSSAKAGLFFDQLCEVFHEVGAKKDSSHP